MLINLTGNVDEHGQIDFDDFPMVYFSQHDYVCLTHLFIRYERNVDNVNGYISSTLIDKSPINPRQELLFFYHKEKTEFFNHSPTHLAEYKIQCNNLQSSLFRFHLSEADKSFNFREKKIAKVYIQLKVESDAGFLRKNKKPV